MSAQKNIAPPFLKQGDCVGIVAPARKISQAELLPSVKMLQSWGLKVKLGKHIYAAYHQFAGADDTRCADMQAMLDDAEVKAIFSARGGYGAVRIIDGLNLSFFKNILSGFADIVM